MSTNERVCIKITKLPVPNGGFGSEMGGTGQISFLGTRSRPRRLFNSESIVEEIELGSNY